MNSYVLTYVNESRLQNFRDKLYIILSILCKLVLHIDETQQIYLAHYRTLVYHREFDRRSS